MAVRLAGPEDVLARTVQASNKPQAETKGVANATPARQTAPPPHVRTTSPPHQYNSGRRAEAVKPNPGQRPTAHCLRRETIQKEEGLTVTALTNPPSARFPLLLLLLLPLSPTRPDPTHTPSHPPIPSHNSHSPLAVAAGRALQLQRAARCCSPRPCDARESRSPPSQQSQTPIRGVGRGTRSGQ